MVPNYELFKNIPIHGQRLNYGIGVYELEDHVWENVATLPWESVRMKLTLPKLGLGSPLGFPKIQSSIIGVKTPHITVFFISLEIY